MLLYFIRDINQIYCEQDVFLVYLNLMILKEGILSLGFRVLLHKILYRGLYFNVY